MLMRTHPTAVPPLPLPSLSPVSARAPSTWSEPRSAVRGAVRIRKRDLDMAEAPLHSTEHSNHRGRARGRAGGPTGSHVIATSLVSASFRTAATSAVPSTPASQLTRPHAATRPRPSARCCPRLPQPPRLPPPRRHRGGPSRGLDLRSHQEDSREGGTVSGAPHPEDISSAGSTSLNGPD